jgi:fructose-specific phosphotransferase system component IIB
MALTDEQQEALARLTVAYPAGLAYTDDRVEAIKVYDGLVESGHAVKVESDDIDGVGYQLSPEMVEAHRGVIEQRADEAGQN